MYVTLSNIDHDAKRPVSWMPFSPTRRRTVSRGLTRTSRERKTKSSSNSRNSEFLSDSRAVQTSTRSVYYGMDRARSNEVHCGHKCGITAVARLTMGLKRQFKALGPDHAESADLAVLCCLTMSGKSKNTNGHCLLDLAPQTLLHELPKKIMISRMERTPASFFNNREGVTRAM
jgi:hypothetical protein